MHRQPCCVFINSYYPAFLQTYYQQHHQLSHATYHEQLRLLQASLFGDSDFYAHHLRAHGWHAEDLIVNCQPLQAAWAREHQSHRQGLDLLIAQIHHLKPDVLYFQDLQWATPTLIQAVRPVIGLLVGQIASPLPTGIDCRLFDLLFSSFPHFVKRFREQGITAYYQPLAFDARVLNQIDQAERDIRLSFIGGISVAHQRGLALLEHVASCTPLQCWGYGREQLPTDSALVKKHHGEVWGTTMFTLLSRSGITINRHIDVAESYANNMRLFEATGCGALLITDYKDNLAELFEIGEEVVAYRDAEECVALIDYYLAHSEKAQRIAEAGQQRTLRDYSYARNMRDTAAILQRHLRYRDEMVRLPELDIEQINSEKTPIRAEQVVAPWLTAWQSPQIPVRQRALVQRELMQLYHGQAPLVFQVLAHVLANIVVDHSRVLEIGCASGYYYEVLRYLLMKRFHYMGIDYSKALIDMAIDYYPGVDFQVADGADIPLPDNDVDVAISSCVLLHVTNAQQHIAEALRVSRRYMVLHRTPICKRRATQYFKKFAYGIEVVELCYQESSLMDLITRLGCRLIQRLEYQTDVERDRFEVSYVFEKVL